MIANKRIPIVIVPSLMVVMLAALMIGSTFNEDGIFSDNPKAGQQQSSVPIASVRTLGPQAAEALERRIVEDKKQVQNDAVSLNDCNAKVAAVISNQLASQAFREKINSVTEILIKKAQSDGVTLQTDEAYESVRSSLVEAIKKQVEC